MDDQFLHQLRRDPPAGFAIRLKWQLDRPAPTRASRARLLLVFAIFGTAFALVSPPVRRLFGDLFYKPAGIAQTSTGESGPRQAPPAAATGASGAPGDAKGLPGSAPSPHGAAVPAYPGLQLLPADGADAPQPVTPDLQPIVTASREPSFLSAQNSVPQTPQMKAGAIVETRQALFKLLGLVTRPLGSMLAGQTPLDVPLARTSAYRLNELSSMIPEIFRTDTSASDARTRALDLIWTQKADFDSKAEALTLAADALEGAIAQQDRTAILKAIGRVQMACQACHDTYRMNP